MRVQKFSLLLSMVGCIAAVETGALVVCIGMMIIDSGIRGAPEGIAVWIIGQFVILPIALYSAPIGALLRLILGLIFQRPRVVALATGTLTGMVGTALVLLTRETDWTNLPGPFLIGALAGLLGGWTWWRVEKSFLERNTLTHPR